MDVQEISFVNDIIQDSRANARIERDYDNLTYLIFNNVRLNWDKTGLILNSDEKLFDFLKIIEPTRYNVTLRQLQVDEGLKEDDEDIPFE